MRITGNWYRCSDGKTRWLDSKTSLARLRRSASRKDRLRPAAVRSLLLFGGTRASAIEAGTDATGMGAAEGESATAKPGRPDTVTQGKQESPNG